MSVETRSALLTDFAGELRQWITTGTCQGQEGAFYAWRDARRDRLSYAYPEITGYALTYLAREREGEPIGRRAADWLVSRIAADKLTARDADGEAVYNFDLAMMATGLLTFGHKLAVDEYIAAGLKLVGFIQDQLLGNGCVLAMSPAYPVSPRKSTWSTHGRAHLLKVVQCLLIAQALGFPRAGEAADLLMKSARELQKSTGRFVTHPADEEVFLHPHLYAAEGLWMWGTALDKRDAIERARIALTWAWSHQLDTGGFPGTVNNLDSNAIGVEQSDVTTQAVRLALLMDMQLPGLDRAIERITQASYRDERGRAILYRPTSTDLHQNTWATIFGSQALEIAIAGTQALPWMLFA